MKHALILANPKPRSFSRMMADAYADAATAAGHEVVLRDLYALGFDPRLMADEVPTEPSAQPRPDALAEREALQDADVFVFVYPIWFGGPPAILKGYVERVFGQGFGYRSVKAGGMEPLLRGKKLISFTSTGSENAWLVDSGGWDAVRKVFDQRIAQACGLQALDHVNFGGVDNDLPPARVDEAREGVKRVFNEVFG
ncbi:NAD(P)H-dependent oxidoreductase [Brevundimonas sp. 2R-24]|uniref:NAD(P)H-dependent oxidoreductase n=1 Tax=Peiella sedimenti TaxID=3061083 RepID=A0ABT8SMW3_9CAUL|nr:NAD(P)H-dependent oxidoreductase [Caulobacteraceae bacterium XZ-24]